MGSATGHCDTASELQGNADWRAATLASRQLIVSYAYARSSVPHAELGTSLEHEKLLLGSAWPLLKEVDIGSTFSRRSRLNVFEQELCARWYSCTAFSIA
mmetsp:Transcript_4396/g.6548  ORF Transcript_4396/g.6548 Transcript_4396/m.6548 type:complete len:100 (-) Transcript_4396:570-869(-)